VVDAIRHSRPPLIRAEEALVVQAIVDGIYRSAHRGREVGIEAPGV